MYTMYQFQFQIQITWLQRELAARRQQMPQVTGKIHQVQPRFCLVRTLSAFAHVAHEHFDKTPRMGHLGQQPNPNIQ